MNESKMKWKEGEKRRQSNFLNCKVEKVQEATIKSLQPEVRLMVKELHSATDQMKKDVETRKRYLMKEFSCNLEQRIAAYSSEASNQNL